MNLQGTPLSSHLTNVKSLNNKRLLLVARNWMLGQTQFRNAVIASCVLSTRPHDQCGDVGAAFCFVSNSKTLGVVSHQRFESYKFAKLIQYRLQACSLVVLRCIQQLTCPCPSSLPVSTFHMYKCAKRRDTQRRREITRWLDRYIVHSINCALEPSPPTHPSVRSSERIQILNIEEYTNWNYSKLVKSNSQHANNLKGWNWKVYASAYRHSSNFNLQHFQSAARTSDHIASWLTISI